MLEKKNQGTNLVFVHNFVVQKKKKIITLICLQSEKITNTTFYFVVLVKGTSQQVEKNQTCTGY